LARKSKVVVKKIVKPDEKGLTKFAVKKKSSGLFQNAKTRKSSDLNIAKNCKKTVSTKSRNPVSL
jgi:hypothetical protein